MHIGTIKEIWRYPVKSMAGERLDSTTVESLGIPGDRGWALRDETTGEITNGKRFPFLMQCSACYRAQPEGTTIPPADITFPDGSTTATDAADVNERLSRLLGKPVTVWPRLPADDLEHYRRKSKAARVFGRLARISAFRSALPTLVSVGNANAELRKMFSREPNERIPDISLLPPELIEFTSPPGTYFDAFAIHLLTTSSLTLMQRLNPEANWDRRRFRPNFLIESELHGFIELEWNSQKLQIGSSIVQCQIPTARCGMTTHAQKDLPKDPSVLRTIVKDADQNLGTYATVVASGTVKVGDAVEIRLG
jgi:MOSC domain-containing protein